MPTILKSDAHHYNMASKIVVEVDSGVADACSVVFAKCGLTTEVAIRMFLDCIASSAANLSNVDRDALFEAAIDRIPVYDRRAADGRLILPSEWNNPLDDVYDL